MASPTLSPAVTTHQREYPTLRSRVMRRIRSTNYSPTLISSQRKTDLASSGTMDQGVARGRHDTCFSVIDTACTARLRAQVSVKSGRGSAVANGRLSQKHWNKMSTCGRCEVSPIRNTANTAITAA